MATSGELWRPPVGTFVSTYGEALMAADKCQPHSNAALVKRYRQFPFFHPSNVTNPAG